jgi:hypothetical protein
MAGHTRDSMKGRGLVIAEAEDEGSDRGDDQLRGLHSAGAEPVQGFLTGLI